MQAARVSKGMFLVVLMMLASLSGCFGEEEVVTGRRTNRIPGRLPNARRRHHEERRMA